MSDVCGDNRFEIIEAYKKKLIEDTNIETRPDEMAVIDNILLRFWQMGWLPSAQPEITNEEIRFSLKQLRVYLIIKIRDGKEGGVPIELLKRVEEIQEYFENAASAQQDVPDINVGDTIYRQDAVREIANHLGIPAENWMKIAEEWLRDVPSAEPEVVYCKKCKHWTRTCGDEQWGLGDCDVFNKHLVMCNGYCAWAERRQDELRP